MLPRPSRNRWKIAQCRPRPVTDAPAEIPDSKVGQFDALLQGSGILPLIDDELANRPGPSGLPVRTVLVGILLSLHYHRSATLADVSRLLLDELRPKAREWLGVVDTDRDDSHARIAFSRRVYRAFDRLTTAFDPYRCDRRRRLPLAEAALAAAAWRDDEPEHVRLRERLQEISDRLLLIAVGIAHRKGYFKGWQGDIGADTTAVPTWQRPPKWRRGMASVEYTAGWHFSAGADEGTFGHSATLLVAASRRFSAGSTREGKRSSRHPQLLMGLVLDTPGKQLGPNAIHALKRLTPFGLPTGLLAADRAYTDQTTEHFAKPARELGYQLVLDYRRAQRGLQGSHLGALLVDGSLTCPQISPALVETTTMLEDKAVRRINDNPQLTHRIAAREPHFLKLKQSADARGAIRLQCPAAGTSPSVTCARFNRINNLTTAPATTVDLNNRRATAAHAAAKPTVLIDPTERLRPPPTAHLPEICQHPTITVRPGDLGMIDKFRQDRHYLTPAWQDVYKPIRAHNEGANGRAKTHYINIGDPTKRLAHGRTAQTILLALMICSINLHILTTWEATTGQPPVTGGSRSVSEGASPASEPVPTTISGIPPP